MKWKLNKKVIIFLFVFVIVFGSATSLYIKATNQVGGSLNEANTSILNAINPKSGTKNNKVITQANITLLKNEINKEIIKDYYDSTHLTYTAPTGTIHLAEVKGCASDVPQNVNDVFKHFLGEMPIISDIPFPPPPQVLSESGCSSETLQGSYTIEVYQNTKNNTEVIHISENLHLNVMYYDANCQLQSESSPIINISWITIDTKCNPDESDNTCILNGNETSPSLKGYTLIYSCTKNVNVTQGKIGNCDRCSKPSPTPSPSPTPTASPSPSPSSSPSNSPKPTFSPTPNSAPPSPTYTAYPVKDSSSVN